MPEHDPVTELGATADTVARTAALDEHHARALRSALVEFMQRHVDLLDLLAAGVPPTQAVTDGVIGHWPDHAEVADGLPRHGAELLPIAHAVIDAAADPDAVVHAASAAASHLGRRGTDELRLVELVALEAADALVVWHMGRG